ncbi:MAG TPA: serine hydrolase [Steroidobacteraceae bacterium]|jgi:CubicO group peptidase (beta-lactamase class C family)|nr:serine hydrolase [Steroidobacteraceae bacterium]
MFIWRTAGLVELVLLLCGWAAAGTAFAGSGPPADMDAYAARVLRTFGVPGLSVAIVKDGRMVFARGYGVRKLGESAPVDENTLFPIGSNTKAFTSALLASLVDAGKLSWDDPVYERLPGFQMYDPYVSHEMTIRDLLTHRSGMGLGEGDLLFWPTTTYTRDEIIHKLRFMKPASSFRSRFAYDNLMYIAAGQIIPAVTGETWESYVRARVLDPLGMKTTTLDVAALEASSNHAHPHERVDGVLRPIEFVALDNAAPAGAINSSVAEMSSWLRLQLDRGRFPDGTRLFSEARSREMWTAQTILPNREFPGQLVHLKSSFAAYGLGWGLRDYRGRELVEHTGGVAGFVSRVMLVPEENLGVVILTNAESAGAFDSLLYHVLDHYFGVPKTDWVAAFKSAEDEHFAQAAEFTKHQDAERAAGGRPALPSEKYAGVYRDAWYGTATIHGQSGGLVFTLDHTPAAVGDLTYWQYDTFKAHWRDRTMEDAFLTFTLKPDGSIDHFTMKAVSPLADFSFDYQDLLFTPVLEEKH